MPKPKAKKKPESKVQEAFLTTNMLATRRQAGKRITLYLLLGFAIMIFCGAIGAGFYLNYAQTYMNREATVCNEMKAGFSNLNHKVTDIEDKVDKLKVAPIDDEKQKLLIRAANKYHIVLFSNQIIEKVAKLSSYSESISNLREFAEGKYDKELKEIEEAHDLALTSDNKLIDALKKQPVPPTEPGQPKVMEKTWGEKVKGYFADSFKVRKTTEVNLQKTENQHISEAHDKISAGQYDEAITALNAVSHKDENINFVIKVLQARATTLAAAKKIMADALK